MGLADSTACIHANLCLSCVLAPLLHAKLRCMTALLLSAGRAAAYLTKQQEVIAQSDYLDLKGVVLTTCEGTLERLSKMPGWKRQSARKK